MADNITAMSHTNHVDIRHKYVNEYVKDGIVKIMFIKFAENDNNIFTKNNKNNHKKDLA